jgi:hypothetical protein
MSMKMEEEVKRWTVRRKSALVLGLLQGERVLSPETDTSVKPHDGVGGVSWHSEESTAKSSSVRRLA